MKDIFERDNMFIEGCDCVNSMVIEGFDCVNSNLVGVHLCRVKVRPK